MLPAALLGGKITRTAVLVKVTFLHLSEHLVEFNPFLKEHIEKHDNKGKGKPSYLTSTACEEFVSLKGQKTKRAITEEIRKANYFYLIVGSTPVVAKVIIMQQYVWQIQWAPVALKKRKPTNPFHTLFCPFIEPCRCKHY